MTIDILTISRCLDFVMKSKLYMEFFLKFLLQSAFETEQETLRESGIILFLCTFSIHLRWIAFTSTSTTYNLNLICCQREREKMVWFFFFYWRRENQKSLPQTCHPRLSQFFFFTVCCHLFHQRKANVSYLVRSLIERRVKQTFAKTMKSQKC